MDLIIARGVNWLPPPMEARKICQTVDENDLFPKGLVVKFYPHQGYGYIKNSKGEEILFRLEELSLVGPKDKHSIAVGVRVGYDVSCTSSGLHVSILKVY